MMHNSKYKLVLESQQGYEKGIFLTCKKSGTLIFFVRISLMCYGSHHRYMHNQNIEFNPEIPKNRHTLKILHCQHRKIFKVYLAIFQHFCLCLA